MIGIYAHPVPPDAAVLGLKSYPVKRTWTTTIGHFITDYAAKSALWLRKVPL